MIRRRLECVRNWSGTFQNPTNDLSEGYRRRSESLSEPYPNPIRKPIRKPIRTLSEPYPNPIRTLSETYPKPIRNLSETYPKPIRNLSETNQNPSNTSANPNQKPIRNVTETYQNLPESYGNVIYVFTSVRLLVRAYCRICFDTMHSYSRGCPIGPCAIGQCL